MRADLNIILNGNSIFRIDVREGPNIRLVAEIKIDKILNKPVVFGWHTFFDFGKHPAVKAVPFSLFFVKGRRPPPPMFRDLLILLHKLRNQ